MPEHRTMGTNSFPRQRAALALAGLCLAGPGVAGPVQSETSLAPSRLDTESAADGAASLPGRGEGFVARPVHELLVAPLVDRDDAGSLWVRTRGMRAHFEGARTTVYPVFGPASPREWPVRIELESARIGAVELELGPAGSPQHEGARIAVDRGALREVHILGLDAIEQTFELDSLPSVTGDLVVELSVETDLSVELGVDGDALRFVHETLGYVEYGAAFALDGAGQRVSIPRIWTGTGIELRVPAAFLAGATLPLTIDPLISSFSSSYGVADDARPDIVFCGQTNEYLACWEEYTSAANSDVYLTKWDQTLTTQGGAIVIDITNNTWVAPRIAYTYGPDRALVVASVDPVPTGLPSSAIRGRLVDVGAFTADGSVLTLSTIGAPKDGVDVGGSSKDSLVGTHFCVVWSEEVAPGDRNVRYRVVDWDGSSIIGPITVDASPEIDVTPSISKGLGKTTLLDPAWTIVWIRQEVGLAGQGQVHARRVAWDGDPTVGNGNFIVDHNWLNKNPVVSSLVEVEPTSVIGRPAVVAYERVITDPAHPAGEYRRVMLKPVLDGVFLLGRTLGSMEDFDSYIDQHSPSITTNGRGFYIAYLEESYTAIGSGDWNVYLATGGLSETEVNVDVALAERHVPLATTTSPEHAPRLTTRWDGETASYAVDGAALWTRQGATTAPGFGGLHGARFDHLAATLFGPQAVGTQYCDANPNSVGTGGGRNSSWLRILGNQSTSTDHTAQCIDMPPNAFGYLNVALASGNLNLPGGSQGRLCLSGSIGRYVDQIAFSGASGSIEVTIDPSAIPQPNGPVAVVPGDTWYFQVWHRDSLGGIATSNFSNACRVYFKN
jgi:hypothetical protein